MEEVSGEALNLMVIILDSQDNPIRNFLGESIKTTGRCPYLSDFLLAVHTCVHDSITVSKGRSEAYVTLCVMVSVQCALSCSISIGFQ